MNDRTTNPIVAPLITRPGESAEYIGTRSVKELLPNIFQTTINTGFLDSTLEQLMSSGSLQSINNMVGGTYNKKTTSDSYLTSDRKFDSHQFVPGVVNRDNNNNITSALSYADMIAALQFNNAEVNQQNISLSENGYTLDLPINYDMFTAYHNYFWLVDILPPCDIKPTSASPINVDHIVGAVHYETPTTSIGKKLNLYNGMRIRFMPTVVQQFTQSGNTNIVFSLTNPIVGSIDVWKNNVLQTPNTDYTIVGQTVEFTSAPTNGDKVQVDVTHVTGSYNPAQIYIVDGVGNTSGIKLTTQYTRASTKSNDDYYNYDKRTWINNTICNTQSQAGFNESATTWDFDPTADTEVRNDFRDYVVESRWNTDQSAWARSNLWMHEKSAQAALSFQGKAYVDWIVDTFRATRPVIEFRDSIEKYNSGVAAYDTSDNSTLYVTHLVEDSIDPATAIIGQTSWNHTVGTTATEWETTGYDLGQTVKITINGVPIYYECLESHGITKSPQDPQNSSFWNRIEITPLQNGDSVLFVGGTNAAYNNNMYTVSGIGFGINLTLLHTPSVVGTKVSVIHGYNRAQRDDNEITHPRSGSEWFWSGTQWVYGQQKTKLSSGILFNLYDINFNSLTSSELYPNSTFVGDKIFDFGRNASSTLDAALGFSPRYIDYGNTPGLSFDFGLGAVRYNYNNINTSQDQSNLQEINGYYYYKNTSTNEYHNGWVVNRSKQPVLRHIQKTAITNTTPLSFILGTTDVGLDTNINITYKKSRFYVDGTNGSNPALFIDQGKDYTVKCKFSPSDIEFVNMDGTPFSGLTQGAIGTNDAFTINVAANVSSKVTFKYRLVANPSIYGVVYVTDNTATNNIKVLKNGVPFTNYTYANGIITISTLAVNDIFDVTYHSNSALSEDAEGEFLPADSHILNPQNELLTTCSYADVATHMRQQLAGIPQHRTETFGENNYHVMPQIHEFGGTIRQQPFSTELLGQLISDTDTNPFSAIGFAAQSYRRFKAQFLQKVRQLHNSTDINTPVHEIVDAALAAINLGKNTNSAFNNSNMAMYQDYESEDYSWTTAHPAIFNLPNTVNTYDDAKNHIQVWVQDLDSNNSLRWRILEASEYSLTQNTIAITSTMTFDASGLAYAHIRWYPQNAVSFIPSSAVKLGLVRPYTPEQRTDYSSASNGTSITDSIIIGHDGSVHVRNGTELYNRETVGFDILDAALWDLEIRISNNLNSELHSVTSYQEIMPTAQRSLAYTWNDLNNKLLSEFNNWKVRNNISILNGVTYYNAVDEFSWNYSSVGPGIGGWRGLYHYYFNTDRPNTHPWEMLGFNTKPTWWDTNYNWTDAPKRASLIAALKWGKTSNPALLSEFNSNFAYAEYDWDNDTLVKNTGALNSPATANVVPTPTAVNASKDFVFGDWGPVEAEWRRSSEYKVSLTLALMRLRPNWVLNTYFSSTTRKTTTQTDRYAIADYIKDKNQLGNNRIVNLSGVTYPGSIIESVSVINGGSGYTSSPTLTVFDSFGSGATLSATINAGTITSVSVASPGENYYSKPTITVSLGTATFDVTLIDNAKTYASGMSNSIIDYLTSNKANANELAVRFKNLQFNPIIRAGGFVNPNNQNFILESSQDKGKVAIPEENYNTILCTSKPSSEIFIGGVKVTKVDTGYSVSGFDNSNNSFTYFMPLTSSTNATVISDNFNVTKHSQFETTSNIISYNTILPNVQQVYDVIRGHGEYARQQGWQETWDIMATNFLDWADTAKLNESSVLMPSTSTISIADGPIGYYDNVDQKYDGIYNIIDPYGNQISSNEVYIIREINKFQDAVTTITVKDPKITFIAGIRLYKVELEHAIVFDNKSNFDDVIYSPALGQRHVRIKWRGSKTKNWNGKLYTPGYVVTDNTIIDNLDTSAREMDQYYGRGNTINNQQIVDVARFNVGYNKPEWSSKLDIDDDTLYEFMKGTRKYRGTRLALDAFMRNKSLFDGDASAELHEEWAIRTADYGDTRSRNTIEFQLTPELLTTSPQPVRFSKEEVNDILTDVVVDVDHNSPLLVTGTPGDNFTTRTPRITEDESTISYDSLYANDFITAGLPLTNEVDYRVLNRDDLALFPLETKSSYNFAGEWQDVYAWNNRTSYKFNDKILYQGKTWEMIDTDGSSGLASPNDPITVTGSITLPTVTSNAANTLILDNTSVSLTKTATATVQGVIQKIAGNDLVSSNVVTHGSSLVLGTTSATAQTIVFSNVVNTTTFNNIDITGTTTNPIINGDSTKTLIIDGTTVTFNENQSNTANITAATAYSNAFTTAGIFHSATNRILALESLRSAYVAVNGGASWANFMATYCTSSGQLNVTQLLVEYNTTPAYQSQLGALITDDVAIINLLNGSPYTASNVLSGVEIITPAHLASSQAAIANGQYMSGFKTYLTSSSNASSVISDSTVVTTDTSTGFKIYSLSDIVNRITSFGITNIAASASSNRLRITKTTATPGVTFSLVIGNGLSNADVGIAAGTTNSTSSVGTTTPNLTLTQVVTQINAANITNVSAQANSSNTNLLQINCNATTLFIGGGTSNSIIGLTTGVTLAGTTTTTTDVNLDITAIIEKINTKGISGVNASNSNNRLKITSTNPNLIVGSGTSNGAVGITALTYSATQSTVANVFEAIVNNNVVFQQMSNDPNLFSVWVADDSFQGNANRGYAVYQTMDFGMFATKICQGITAADDAEIVISCPTGTTQAHNLKVGDFVLIRGSNSKPNIDGIHKVTKVDPSDTRKFFIDEYIETEATEGNVYPLRNITFKDRATLDSKFNNRVLRGTNDQSGVYEYNFSGYRQNNQQKPVYAFVNDDGFGVPTVYKWTGTFSSSVGHTNGIWLALRTMPNQARNDLIENIKIYDAKAKSTITTIETFDPAKGIIPGFVKNEIEFIVSSDIATYNFTTIDGELNEDRCWGSEYVGKRWWDINRAIYLNYEQGSIDYQQSNWGRLFDGSSVDIYEWTRSPVLPEQWEQFVSFGNLVDGQPASGEAYTASIDGENLYYWAEESYYNNRTSQTETFYYFWVKNKTNYFGQRNYNTFQLARLMEDPTAFDLSWCAASSNNILFINNVDKYVTNDTVVQVNQIYESNALPLNEWTLLSDGDIDSTIPEQLHIKMRDSLSGFNNYQERVTYAAWSSAPTYKINDVVTDGGKYYVSTFPARLFGQDVIPDNINQQPSLDTAMTYWAEIQEFTLPAETETDDINIWRGQMVPDLNLHEFNRYGQSIRPVQSLFRNLVDARHNFVYSLNKLLSETPIVSDSSNWNNTFNHSFTNSNVTYSINKYWNWVDWIRTAYDSNGNVTYKFDKNTTPTYTYNSIEDYYDSVGIVTELDGDYMLIKNVPGPDSKNRSEMYVYENGGWILCWKKLGTIQVSEELWNQSKFGHGFDAVGFDITPFDSDSSVVISELFDLIRTELFIGRHAVKYNKLWFDMLYEATTQNTTDDFAFKTTFVKLQVNRPLSINQPTYENYDVSVVEDFINDIKPFHTKLRSSMESTTYAEAVGIETTEQSRNSVITMKYEDHTGRSWAGDTTLSGGPFATTPENVDASTFTTLDASLEYVYNGNNFDQSAYEGWGEELYPTDFTENISILVQTNASGSTYTSDTRSFRMNMYMPQNIQESTAIVDATRTFLAFGCTVTDTEIVLNQVFASMPLSGVVWVGTERIEYGAYEGATLRYCTRGTRGTSAQAHAVNALVNYELTIPVLENFGHYGDNLRLAYNDSGVSLAAAGTTPEHAFIRSAGQGSI